MPLCRECYNYKLNLQKNSELQLESHSSGQSTDDKNNSFDGSSIKNVGERLLNMDIINMMEGSKNQEEILFEDKLKTPN